MIHRLRLEPGLTPAQDLVARLVSEGKSAKQVAEILGVKETTARYHIREAAGRIPGTLPAMARLTAWYRGATLAVLNRSGV